MNQNMKFRNRICFYLIALPEKVLHFRRHFLHS